jgi:hypothetical protein
MRQRGRRSAASLSVVAMMEVPRPAPPRSMERAEKAVWRDVVARFQPTHFVGCEHLLEIYCQAVVMSRWLTEQVKATDRTDSKRLKVLVQLQKAEAMLVGNLAGKLRVSPRSRLDRYAAAARPVSTLPKPWELGADPDRRRDDSEPGGGSGSPFSWPAA